MEGNIRAMSWNAPDVTWVSIDGAGNPNALTLRQAFHSSNEYNVKWQQIMRDPTVINSILFQTSDGVKITRERAFELNDLVNDLPDPVIDAPESASATSFDL